MSSDARMIGVHVDGDRALCVSLDRSWLVALRRGGFVARTAVDVGEPVLTSVIAVSVVEAQKINAQFRAQVEEDLRRKDADASDEGVSRDVYIGRLGCADRVDGLLARLGRVTYFSPWVIVEEADID